MRIGATGEPDGRVTQPFGRNQPILRGLAAALSCRNILPMELQRGAVAV